MDPWLDSSSVPLPVVRFDPSDLVVSQERRNMEQTHFISLTLVSLVDSLTLSATRPMDRSFLEVSTEPLN